MHCKERQDGINDIKELVLPRVANEPGGIDYKGSSGVFV